MSVTTWIAAYGAVVSTVAVAWNIVYARAGRVRLKLDVVHGVYAGFVGGSDYGIELAVTNKSSKPVRVDSIELGHDSSPSLHLPSQQIVPEAGPQFPPTISPGSTETWFICVGRNAKPDIKAALTVQGPRRIIVKAEGHTFLTDRIHLDTSDRLVIEK